MIPSLNVKTSVPTLSALQLVKGVKKDEETFPPFASCSIFDSV